MTRKSNSETANFDHALSDAFQGGPDCGAFGTFDDLSRRRMINDILDTASVAKPCTVNDDGKRRDGVRGLTIGVAAAVVFVTLGIFYLWTEDSSRTVDASHFDEAYFGEVEEYEGDLFLGDKSASLNAPVPLRQSIRTADGTALLRLPTGISWRMERHSQARITTLDSNDLEVKVISGESWFRVDPTREGPSFSVDTKMGRIVVTGTILVVNAAPSDVHVTLLEGEVWVVRPSGQRVLVKTGYTMRLRDGEQHALVPEEKRRLRMQLTKLTWETERAPVASVVPEIVDDADKNPNSVDTPASWVRETVSDRELDSLHDEIQIHRKRRDWRQVANLYKRLIRSAPGSETAIVSRVSLGDIYLTKLHRYKDALFQFDKYLRSGHSALLPEALYGKCNTLKALGTRDREMKCLVRFIHRFADAFQAPDAKVRLEALRSEGRI